MAPPQTHGNILNGLDLYNLLDGFYYMCTLAKLPFR